MYTIEELAEKSDLQLVNEMSELENRAAKALKRGLKKSDSDDLDLLMQLRETVRARGIWKFSREQMQEMRIYRALDGLRRASCREFGMAGVISITIDAEEHRVSYSTAGIHGNNAGEYSIDDAGIAAFIEALKSAHPEMREPEVLDDPFECCTDMPSFSFEIRTADRGAGISSSDFPNGLVYDVFRHLISEDRGSGE